MHFDFVCARVIHTCMYGVLASSPGLCILRGWKTKAWYTLFTYAYNFNQNSVKLFISEQICVLFTSLSQSALQWRLLLVLLSEVPS